MKNTKPNAALIWKQLEDQLVSRFHLTIAEHVVYFHLLRHTRLEGKLQIRFSIPRLTRGVLLSAMPVRRAVRGLAAKGVLRLVERTTAGHVVEVRLPSEIPAPQPQQPAVPAPAVPRLVTKPEDGLDFLRTPERRHAIHTRDRGLCFYCLSRLTSKVRCLDHVVPRTRLGNNGYRNLVSCCVDCNARKGETAAEDFLRTLHRDRRLTATELAARLRALDALAAGKLRPVLETPLLERAPGASPRACV